jgi:assimilatory nitrate reductase catalytic subunit
MSRTGTLGRLFGHAGEPALDLHPQDLQRRHWRDGDLVRVQSRRGSAGAAGARQRHGGAGAGLRRHALGRRMAGRRGRRQRADHAALCPQSRQPELKHAAVR